MRIAGQFPDEIFTVSSCPLSYGDKHDVSLPLPLAQGIAPRVKKARTLINRRGGAGASYGSRRPRRTMECRFPPPGKVSLAGKE
jgi:hypothetical protein